MFCLSLEGDNLTIQHLQVDKKKIKFQYLIEFFNKKKP